MRAAILAALQADAALMAALSGGLYDAAIVGVISRATTPAAFDASAELRPCGLLRLTDDRPVGPLPTSARLTADLILLSRANGGTAPLETARARAYAALHRQALTPATGGAWELAHAQDILGGYDDALDAHLITCRYTAPIRKA